MVARARIWLAYVALACATAACGDDSDPGDVSRTPPNDAGPKMDAAGEGGSGGNDSGPKQDSSVPPPPEDASVDAGEDATVGDGSMPPQPPIEPVPEQWACAPTLWHDGWCDCGCELRDADCFSGDCIEPGCIADSCDACFTAEHTWKTCEPPVDPNDWSCALDLRSDSFCDCGCGIPDSACIVENCSTPGCRKPLCDTRNGCGTGVTESSDGCTTTNPQPLTSGLWRCPWDSYGAEDGCDCGCGALDPDCAGDGCVTGQCFDAQCDTCHDGDGRPYSCAAAEGGWDENIEQSADVSKCNPLRFGTGDGCDCGCGGHDPDCGDGNGCATTGCSDDACDRCTDLAGEPIGCAPFAWLQVCPPQNYGTGDGCDCGCGAPDPDCDGDGSSDPEQLTDACQVCHDGVGPYNSGTHYQRYVKCPSWDCTEAAWGTAECDCGCGAIDPYCRDLNMVSCTAPNCTSAACEYCNDGSASRTACGPTWGADGITCNLEHYGIDGLCDCGCGAVDPDCGSGGCTEQGCNAPACEVCHDTTTIGVCDPWRCDTAAFDAGDGVCDCGCGAIDPDCGSGGCKAPGCSNAECDVCYDPHSRVVTCP